LPQIFYFNLLLITRLAYAAWRAVERGFAAVTRSGPVKPSRTSIAKRGALSSRAGFSKSLDRESTRGSDVARGAIV